MRAKISKAANAAAGFAFMLCLYFFCDWLLDALHVEFPASLTAMMLLFALLCLKIVPLSLVENAANLLLKNMVFFFVPLLTVLPKSYNIYKDSVWAILFALVISSALVMITTALVSEKIAARDEGRGESESGNNA